MPNRVALLRAELEAAHPGAVLKHRGEAGFSMLLPNGTEEHRYTTGPWHWRQTDLHEWTEIDTDLETRAGTFSRGVKSARFDTTIAPNGRRRFYPRRWITDEYCEFGVLQWNTTGNTWATVTLGTGAAKQGCPNVLAYDRTTHAYEIGINGRGCRTHLTLKSVSVARSIRWPVTLVGLTLKDGAFVSVKDSEQVGYLRPPSWTDASENAESHTVPWAYAGGHITLTPDFTGAVFPIDLDPDYAIAADADDVTATFTALGATPVCSALSGGTTVVMGNYTTGPGLSYFGFLRFDGISAAKDADCTAAAVAFKSTAAGTNSGLVSGSVWLVDDQDDYTMPADIDGAETDYVNRTSAVSADWSWDATAAGQTGTTPDLSGCFDEVFSRAGWATGQAVGVIIGRAITDLANNQSVASYANTSYTEPVLSLTLAASGTPQTLVGATSAAATIAGGLKLHHYLIGEM